MSVRQRQLASVLPRTPLPRARSLALPPSICPRVGTGASRHESVCSPNASGESAGAPPDGGGLTPVSDTVVDGRRVLVYECTWNTLDTHNFPHRLVATAAFSPGGGEMPGGGGTGGVTKTAETQPVVGNLLVKDVSVSTGDIDYFRYDPNGDPETLKQPQFHFTIDDPADAHEYRWVVYMRPTPASDWSPQGDAYRMGDATAAGPVTTTWNGLQYNNTGELQPRNTYTYDIYLWEVEDADTFNWEPELRLDHDELKTPYSLRMPETYTLPDGTIAPGHEVEFVWDSPEENEVVARVGYCLTDCSYKDATDVRFDLLDEDFTVRSAYTGGTSDRTPYGGIDVYSFTEEESDGLWRGVFTAIDDHADRTRDHAPVHMLAINKRRPAEDPERSIKVQSSEIVARKYFEHEGWQVLWDPAKRHPYRPGNPDLVAVKQVNGQTWLTVLDNKMTQAARIVDADDVPGLLAWGPGSNWYVFVEDLLAKKGTPAMQDALLNGRVYRYASNAGGLAYGVSATLAADGIGFVNVRAWDGYGHAWRPAWREATTFHAQHATIAGKLRKLGKAGAVKDLLEHAGKVATPILIATYGRVAYERVQGGASWEVALAYAANEAARDNVFADEVEAVGAWASAKVDAYLRETAKFVWQIPYLQAILRLLEE